VYDNNCERILNPGITVKAHQTRPLALASDSGTRGKARGQNLTLVRLEAGRIAKIIGVAAPVQTGRPRQSWGPDATELGSFSRAAKTSYQDILAPCPVDRLLQRRRW
jgi:hypothetical protein